MSECFTVGDPRPGESLKALMRREIRLRYGELPDGTTLEARAIFAPHATGDPRDFAVARRHVIAQLVDEAKAGRITFNPDTGHLRRPAGTCVFCPMLEIGPCDYVHELQPLSVAPRPRGGEPAIDELQHDKLVQQRLMSEVTVSAPPVRQAWGDTDEVDEPSPGPAALRAGSSSKARALTDGRPRRAGWSRTAPPPGRRSRRRRCRRASGRCRGRPPRRRSGASPSVSGSLGSVPCSVSWSFVRPSPSGSSGDSVVVVAGATVVVGVTKSSAVRNATASGSG